MHNLGHRFWGLDLVPSREPDQVPPSESHSMLFCTLLRSPGFIGRGKPPSGCYNVGVRPLGGVPTSHEEVVTEFFHVHVAIGGPQHPRDVGELVPSTGARGSTLPRKYSTSPRVGWSVDSSRSLATCITRLNH